ncbi:MAG: fibronectin type III domain-containing protein [Tepidisphaera sp.]
MSILPETVIQQIEFCEAHNPVWSAAPAAVGLNALQCTALTTATANARKAFNDAQVARQASKAFTTTLNSSAGIMRGQVADLIRQIKAFAELQANPSVVYAAAQIPAPTPPTPLPAPGKPANFSVTLEPDGSVTLSWDAVNAAASSGTFFTVSRKLPGTAGFVGIGGAPGITSESRRAFFTDSTVPASAAASGAQYIVQGFRGTRSGEPSDAVTVQFGLGEGTTFTSVRLAA